MARGGVPHSGLGSPHRGGGCSAALDIEIWGTSSASFRSGKKFRLCGIEGGELLGIDKTKTTFAPTRTAAPFTRLPDIHHPRCFLAGIFVSPCDLLFGRPRIHLHRLRSTCRISRHVLKDCTQFGSRTDQPEDGEMKTRYDTKATGHQFKEGDKVWFYNPTRRKGLSPKLQSHWDGPIQFLKIINDVVIRIRKSTNSKPRVVHYDELAPYYGHNS
ncbi:integrase core domain protein [Trichonephila clavipes]|nr:integrase core domain protein [Trichonephila clavipes]